MTHRCVLLASALLLSVFSSSHSQDADKKKELERRYSELLGKAAALHVDLARWLEKEGQLAWAKYQYEWALEVVPGQADATAALAKEGVKWENKHQRFEQLDKSLVKGTVSSITPRPNWDKDPTIDYEVRFQSTADKPVYLNYALRKKSNGFIHGSRSIVELLAKSPGAHSGIWMEEFDSETVKAFKGIDVKDVEVLITSVFRENANFSRLKGELLKRFNVQGTAVGIGLAKLGQDAESFSSNELAANTFRKAIVYDRDNALARQHLSFTKNSGDFAVAWIVGERGHITGTPRWWSSEESKLRNNINEIAAKGHGGEKCEHRGRPARANKVSILFPIEPISIEDVENANRLIEAWMKVFNEWVGAGKDLFAVASQTPLEYEIRIHPDFPSTDLLKKQKLSYFLDDIITKGFASLFGFSKGGIRGNWVSMGVALVFSKLMTGYSYHPNYDLGTSNSAKLPRERELRAIANWHDPIRESVVTGTFAYPELVLGVPVNLLDQQGELQLWSYFHYLITMRSTEFWKFISAFSQDRQNLSGMNHFKRLLGELAVFNRQWRQFVLETY